MKGDTTAGQLTHTSVVGILCICGLVLAGALLLAGCSPSSARSASDDTDGNKPLPIPPFSGSIEMGVLYQGSASNDRATITIANPVADGYKIGIMETGSSADDSAANITMLTATTADGTDHSTRLRRGGLIPITNPIAAVDSNVGVVNTFLPGDDAAATKPNFSMLWGSYPNGAGQLAASIDYTLTVTAATNVAWYITIEKITELPRLPANIQTRARRGMCADTPPNVVAGDTVSCDESGPSVTGQGFYLIYSSTANQLNAKIEDREIDDETTSFDTSIEGIADTDMDGVSDPTTVSFRAYNDCVNTLSEILNFFLFRPLTADGMRSIGADEHVYCVELIALSTGNLASDRLQFILNF